MSNNNNNNSIDSLKSVISKRGGLALQNRFKLEITPPSSVSGDTRDFTILCESCTLPSKQILTMDYQSIRQTQKIANGYINEDVTFNFILTNDYIVRKLFDQWSGLVINFNTYRAGYQADYGGTINIYQLAKAENGSEDDKVVYGVRLKKAFPTTFSSITLDNNSDNTVQKYSVTVAFEDFETI